MKKAEEWLDESKDPRSWITSNRFDKSFIEKIQLDALKKGMRVAASLIIPDGNPEIALHQILAASEQLTEKDL